MQQHLTLINKHVNTVKDVPAREFISAFAQHLKQASKFRIPDVSEQPATGQRRRGCARSLFCLILLSVIN
jgi:hypothetical protein